MTSASFSLRPEMVLCSSSSLWAGASPSGIASPGWITALFRIPPTKDRFRLMLADALGEREPASRGFILGEREGEESMAPMGVVESGEEEGRDDDRFDVAGLGIFTL
jgi:hypothetical protein